MTRGYIDTQAAVDKLLTKFNDDAPVEHQDDMVNHPPHYERGGAMECIDEMVMLFGAKEVMSFCKLNAWKYRYRAADKNGQEDIKKSDWYINKYKELKDTSAFTNSLKSSFTNKLP